MNKIIHSNNNNLGSPDSITLQQQFEPPQRDTNTNIDKRKELPWKKQAKEKMMEALKKTKNTGTKREETPSSDQKENSSNTQLPSTDNSSKRQELKEEKRTPTASISSQREPLKEEKEYTNIFRNPLMDRPDYTFANRHQREPETRLLEESNSHFKESSILEKPSSYISHNMPYPHEEITERSKMSYQAFFSPMTEEKRRVEDSLRLEERSYLRKDSDLRSNVSQYPFHEPTSSWRDNKMLYGEERSLIAMIKEKSRASDVSGYYNRFNYENSVSKFSAYERESYRNKENYPQNIGGIYNSGSTDKSINFKKAKVSEILSEMKASQEKLKKSYYSYKLERFQYYLNKVISKVELRHKKICFQQLLHKYYEQDIILSKFFVKQEERLKSLCFYGWEAVKNERQDFMKKQKLREKMAEAFYERRLLKKSFCVGMKEFIVKSRKAREYDEAHKELKKNIDNLILGKNSKGEEKRKEPVEEWVPLPNPNKVARELILNSEDEKDMEEDVYYEDSLEITPSYHNRESPIKEQYAQRANEILGQTPSSQNEYYDFDKAENQYYDDSYLISDRPKDIPTPEKHDELQMPSHRENRYQGERNQRQERGFNRKDMRTPDKKGEQSQNQSEEKGREQPKPTVQELEERARQRREKVLEIRKKHHELKMQKEREREEQLEREREEIRKKQLEERKKLEQKKREEREKQQKKELEEKRVAFMLEEASEFHRKMLMRNFGMNGLKRAMLERKRKIERAEKLNRMKLMKKSFHDWMEALKEIEKMRENEIRHQIVIADGCHNQKLLKLGFKLFLSCLTSAEEANKKYRGHRERVLKLTCFNKWTEVLPNLMKEKFNLDAISDQVVKTFRSKMLGRRSIQAWKEYRDEEKREKFKKAQKDYLWGKVNNWLTDYKKTKKSETGF